MSGQPAPAAPAMESALRTIARGESLTRGHAAEVMELVMSGQVTGAQFGALTMGLHLKGETVDEIAGLASVMRAMAVPVRVSGPAVDTCGTGGDGADTFNVSTVAAFVVTAAGATVAKHGNRAMSSACGSADVLEALGAQVALDAPAVERVIEQVGIGFMFAPLFHPAMRHAVGPRREMRVRTVFNILGPITNPAGARHQVVGVADGAVAGKIAAVLAELGAERALVVHGTDGLDELSIAAPSVVHELRDGTVRSYEVAPEDVGLARAPISALRGGGPQENARIARSVLEGEEGARRDVVVLNAAAALVAAGIADDLVDGVARAGDALASGAALERLERFVAATNEVAAESAAPGEQP